MAGNSVVDALAEFIARTFIYVAVVVFAALWLRRDALRAGLAGLIGALAGLGVAAAIGMVWDRPRPFEAGHYAPLVAHATDAAFPSDHLVVMGALTAAAWLCWRRIGVALAIVAVLLACARGIAGIHYVSDLVGGFLIGAACTVLAWWALTPALPVIDAVDRRLVQLRLRRPEPQV